MWVESVVVYLESKDDCLFHLEINFIVAELAKELTAAFELLSQLKFRETKYAVVVDNLEKMQASEQCHSCHFPLSAGILQGSGRGTQSLLSRNRAF